MYISGSRHESLEREQKQSNNTVLPVPSPAMISAKSQRRAIAMDPITVVVKESILLSSSMRKVSKYSSSSVAAILSSSTADLFSDENNFGKVGISGGSNGVPNGTITDPLLSGFVQLRLMLNSQKDVSGVDALTLLQPFLMVIKSSSTSGSITSLALDSLMKFFNYGIINESSSNIDFALNHVMHSLTHCRFEASEQAADDSVLLKVLKLLEYIIDSDLGERLSDEVVYEVLQTSMSLACNKRRSEVLRKAAELSVGRLAFKIFKKLDSMEPEDNAHAVEETHDYSKDQLIDSIGTNEELEQQKRSLELPKKTEQPFGLPAIKQFLGILISIISPENQLKHNESTKVFGFSLIRTAVEMSGNRFKEFPSLLNLIADPIFKYTLQVIQNVNSISVLQAALQLFTTLTLTLGDSLQPQIELSLRTMFTLIIPQDVSKSKTSSKSGKSTPIDVSIKSLSAKEVIVEELSILWTHLPNLFLALFINYDCNFHRHDLSVQFIEFLAQLSLPESASFTTEFVPPLCLEGLVTFVGTIYDHIKTAGTFNESSLDGLLVDKEKKKEFISATNIFNESPKQGLKRLQEKGFIKSTEDTDELAAFFYERSSRLNKKVLGEFLAKPANSELLVRFMSLFEFDGLRVDEALRILLKAFRLPGESQQIERIVETFAAHYISCQCYSEDEDDQKQDTPSTEETDGENPVNEEEEDDENATVKPDADAVFVLSYSIIMLNTDLHNPNIKVHMTLDDYKKNLKGVYNNKDFPSWYLKKIFESIQDKEIVMPEEHHGSSQWFDDNWNNLMAANASTISTFYSPESYDLQSTLQFEKYIFSSVFSKLFGTFLRIFEIAVDDHVITKMVTMLDRLGQIASFFGYYDIVEGIVSRLSQLTQLTSAVETDQSDNTHRLKLTRIQVSGGETINVSELAVAFGGNFKAQLATIILFNTLKNNVSNITENWSTVIKIFVTLIQNGLVHPDFFSPFQAEFKLRKISRVKPEVTLTRNSVTKGLLSTFASYLKGDDEPTDEEVEATLSALDCIKSADVGSIFNDLKLLVPHYDVIYSALFEQLPEERTPQNEPYFETLMLFIVEACVALTTNDTNCQESDDLLARIEKLIERREELKLQPDMMFRLDTYKLLVITHLKSGRDAVVTKTIEEFLGFEKKIFEKRAPQVIKPLTKLALDDFWAASLVLNDENYWKLLRIIASISDYSDKLLKFAEDISYSKNINNTNFMWLLGLLDEISAVGAIGAQWEQEYDSLVKSGHKITKENPYQDIVHTSLLSIKFTSSLLKLKILSKDETYALIQALAHQCLNPCDQIRSYALSTLEESIFEIRLDNDITPGGLFKFGLFPLLGDGIDKLSIFQLASKLYLHYFKRGQVDNDLFLKLLDNFNNHLEHPEVERELQNLISQKKLIESDTNGNDSGTGLSVEDDAPVIPTKKELEAEELEASID